MDHLEFRNHRRSLYLHPGLVLQPRVAAGIDELAQREVTELGGVLDVVAGDLAEKVRA
jgi:hypothetical protein